MTILHSMTTNSPFGTLIS